MSMPVWYRKNRMSALGTAAATLSLLAGESLAQNVAEIEPNESKASATPVVLTTAGDGTLGSITGFSTGTSTSATGDTTADYFKITVPAAAPGIYRYELLLTGSSDYTPTIRGLTVSSGVVQPGTDIEIQRGSAIVSGFPLGTAFYAFGSAAQAYYRVTGSGSIANNYQVSVVRRTVTPTVIPQTFGTGAITISTLNQTTEDTSFLVLDSNFSPVPTFQNNDATTTGGAPAASSQSYCTRTLAAGTYYLVISDTAVTANQPAPSDDGALTKPVLDFSGSVVTTAPGIPDPASALISDGCQTVVVPWGSSDPAGPTFVQFTVGMPITPCVALSTAGTLAGNSLITFQATVTPGTGPNSAITSVVADLSEFGGSATTPMFNDGSSGGDTAVDSTWSTQLTLDYVPGFKTFRATATDAAARVVSNNRTIVVAPVVPPNDLCSNAIEVSQMPASYTIGCNLATGDGLTLPCRASTHNGIWFSYTPSTSCLLTLKLGGGGSRYLAVFEAPNGCNNLSAPVVCSANLSSGVHVQLQAGSPYLIYASRSSASNQPNDICTMEFSITTPAAPSNDVCGSAIEVDVEDLPFFDSRSIAGAGSDPYASACVRSQSTTSSLTSTTNGIWYHITNGDSYCRLSVINTEYLMPGTVYTGSCSALEEVYCPFDESFVMEPNTSYYVLFSNTTYAGPSDVFAVSFTACNSTTHTQPPNDHCDEAIVIPDGLYASATPYTNTQFVQTADRDSLVTTCGLYQNRSIWYTYTPSQPVRALIKETSTTDGAWALFSGSCGNLTHVSCKTSDTSNNNFVDLDPCVTYSLCMYSQANADTSTEQRLDLSLVTTLNGACVNGTTCTYVTSAANCTGTFMGTGSVCSNNNCCPADFNGDTVRDVSDLFAYINAWLAKTANADFNDSGNVDVADLFAYINAWLAGC